jgi:diacylglycerol kinase family enzyme
VRLLLIANPKATTTSERTRDRVIALLAEHADVRAGLTQDRGHAVELAASAAEQGYDAVVAFGGDGTVNEVVNGLLASGPAPEGPALGIIPGGHANVMAHALGLPRDPVRCARLLAELLRAGNLPTIGLGRADERWFTFNAGLGVDAAVVAAVEDLRGRGVPSSTATYTAGLMKAWVSSDRSAADVSLSARRGGTTVAQAEGLVSAIVQNTRPWTLIGELEVEASPTADLHKGLDVVGVRSLSTTVAVRSATSMLTGRGLTDGQDAVVVADVDEVIVSGGGRRLPLQVDGDLVGDVESVTFTAVPRAIRVVADLGEINGDTAPASA